ncbi:hypothetical protein SOM08_11935 [Hydrogenophaga sp. SNF1]|uniref:Uncharacterized protein n=1 Tax=Hydrogenophaga borbori TaxID=2294117 RepID=A0A372EQ13_9BURK|nr:MULTISPECIES: hypothetical protein [Hydrogenophaga]RFP82720.1 hypothetical protein DY262_02540 [Hydrogenophaga borbori]WQB81726.1 hypothetical protein SOM08_11935 [Hydrogenophaga sp. SNF1]
MEALIFMFDVACMTYVCWRIYKADPKRPTPNDLGYFQYRVHELHPPTDAGDGKRQRKGSTSGRPGERRGA